VIQLRWPGIFAVLIAGGVSFAWQWRAVAAADAVLKVKLEGIKKSNPENFLDCRIFFEKTPVSILVLGQSNAGNHGSKNIPAEAVVTLTTDGNCQLSKDPLPGGTGTGGSIWSKLTPALQAKGFKRPVIFSILAVDGTSMSDWTRRSSPLRIELELKINKMVELGLKPDYIVWQQGESDAKLQTPENIYVDGLMKLDSMMAGHNIAAPILVAKSTVCRSAPGTTIHSAIARAIGDNPRFLPGPNTDSLVEAQNRHDGCHFSEIGLDAAATLWAQALLKVLH
jgi:hypothetical protein